MEGYDNEFIPHPESQYECPICFLVLREPYQTKCGHIFCRDCIMKSLRDSSSRCPMDNEILQETDIYPDNFAKREILNFSVKCPNNKDGCGKILPLRNLQNHLEECFFALVPCPIKCACTMRRTHIEDHIARCCENRLINCEHCHNSLQAKAMENHSKVCLKAVVSCTHCDKKTVRSEMEDHVRNECQKAQVPCPFYPLGCTSNMLRSFVDEHLILAGSSHMKQLCLAVTTLAQKLGIAHLISRTSLNNLNTDLNLTNSVIPGSVMDPESTPDIDPDYGSSMSSTDLTVNPPVQRLYLSNFSPTASTLLNRDTQNASPFFRDQVNEASSHSNSDVVKIIQEMRTQFYNREAAFKQKFEELQSRFTAVEQANSDLVKSVKDLNQHVVDTSSKYCNGDFCWSINNFSQYRFKLEAGESTNLLSPPFYTSPWGYKICIRANIHEYSGNKQLSLFVHFLRSKNDTFLMWPFSGTIVISVIDQNPDSSKRILIKDSLEAHPNMAAFQKPTTSINKGVGYNGFLSFSSLTNGTFLMHDTLIIRAQVLSNFQYQ